MRTEYHGTRGRHRPVPRHSAVCRRHRSVPGSAAELVRLLQGIRCVVRKPDSVHLCRAGCGCGTMRPFGGVWTVAGVAAAFGVLTRLCRRAVCVFGCAWQTHPFDTVRRQMQLDEATGGIRSGWQAARRVFRAHGMRGLYAGFTASALKVMPAVATSLLFRDMLLGRVDSDHKQAKERVARQS